MKNWLKNATHFLLATALLCLTAPSVNALEIKREPLLVLSYHDIRDKVAEGDGDAYATSTQNFAAHLDWLAGHGYQAVSVSDVVAHIERGTPLPPKAVLLTFDDGLKSVYTKAFPLLRAYNYPALVAVVTSWLDMPEGQTVDYGPRPFHKQDFLTWAELREMQTSGLIETASHSNNMHHGVLANPHGSQTPAAITRIYDADNKRYESVSQYRQRVRDDLDTSATRIHQETGVRPRSIVWPYAAYNSVSNEIAESVGMPVSFDLETRNPLKLTSLHGLGRVLVMGNPDIETLASIVHRDPELTLMRAMQVDLDAVYDPDPAQLNRNLDVLIERIYQVKPSHVFLQAFADPDGNGAADALYFSNRHLPVRADLYGRVAWQIKSRAGAVVYAWLPVIGYEFPDRQWQASNRIAARANDEIPRLDFTRPEVRQRIKDIYEDLAAAGYLEGVLFHDDAYLRDGELPQLPGQQQRTQALIDFSLELKDAAEVWRPKLKTVRNLYARTVLHPESEAWFAQRLSAFKQAYDYTALMAMPWMEGSDRPHAWMDDLVDAVRKDDPHLSHTIFQLQTRDWRTGKPIPGQTLRTQSRRLMAAGVRNLAWYPDDFIADQPAKADARAAFSARGFPYKGP